jgi:uncharacterized protein YdeI (YjbR/CyaY-like superfamily)
VVPTQLPVLSFPSKAAFETWLAGNHQSAPGLWLKIAKKESGHTTVDYAQALEVALCYPSLINLVRSWWGVDRFEGVA